jgi:hypothetical protein
MGGIGKLRAYRQTFRQHRTLLTAPVLIAAVIAGWSTFSPAPAYRSSAALWVDNGSSIPSSLANVITSASGTASASASALSSASGSAQPSASGTAALAGPAALEAEVVSELVLTPGFQTAVARGSLLLPSHESGSNDGGFNNFDVAAVATGPQVLKLSYTGPSPAVARSVLRSLIRQLGAAGSAFGEGIGKTASAFDRRQLAAANSVVAGNQGSLAAYARAHPNANARNDATLRALASEVRLADARRASVQAASSRADLEAQSNGGNATIAMVDPPTLPRGPVTGLASKLMAIVGGAFGGAVMSLLALIAFTPRAPIRWDDEVPLFARLTEWDKAGRHVRVPAARSPAVRAARRQHELHPRQEGV